MTLPCGSVPAPHVVCITLRFALAGGITTAVFVDVIVVDVDCAVLCTAVPSPGFVVPAAPVCPATPWPASFVVPSAAVCPAAPAFVDADTVPEPGVIAARPGGSFSSLTSIFRVSPGCSTSFSAYVA